MGAIAADEYVSRGNQYAETSRVLDPEG